jgi:hypothetical protein
MKHIEKNQSATRAQKNVPFFQKESGNDFFQPGGPVQPFFGGSPVIMKKAETDLAGNYTGNYIFNPGHDGLDWSFFMKVKKYVSKGVLDDAAIGVLRADALARNGSVLHAELLLMAAMRNPGNVTKMQAYSGGGLRIPMSQINKSDEDYLTNFGRDQFPTDILALDLRLLAASFGLSAEKPEDVQQVLDTKAEGYIRQYAGKQFSDQADQLLVSASFSNPVVPLAEILAAMLNGASDSTPGDRIMAGIIYDVAKKAGHPMAVNILSGVLKVDALIPSVYHRIASGEASYMVSTDQDVLKADTIYVPTSLNTFNLADRALIIHELTHAADDLGASRTSQVDSLTLETHAYKEQGRYMMDQILAEPVGHGIGFTNTAAAYTKTSPLYYYSMVAAAKEDVSKYEAVLIAINSNAPMSMNAAAVKADLAMTATVLDTRVRAELVAYRNAKGQQLYSPGTTRVDGPKGQYFHP